MYGTIHYSFFITERVFAFVEKSVAGESVNVRVVDMNLIGTATVLGAGLLGASFAKAAKKYGVAERVCVWSRGATTRAKCAALPEVFDAVFDTPQEAAADADLVVVCAPTANIPELAAQIAPALKKGAIVTDVGSVKKIICDSCGEALKNSQAVFVGSHPMAGSEKIGIDYSDADLFKTRPCFVTPSDSAQSHEAAELLSKVWSAFGMRVYEVAPSKHDEIVANVSHMPHIIAGLQCCCAAEFKGGDLRDYAGPGFRDSTRISSGNPEIWDSIIADNRAKILKALRHFSAKLSETIADIESGDSEKIGGMLRTAKTYRDKL